MLHLTPGAAADALRKLDADRMRRRRQCVDQTGADAPARVVTGGRELVNFCSNDYLGLSRDARLVEAMCRGAREWGAGSGAAHLVTGHTREHHLLEEALAHFTGREAALLFSTGYMANVGVLAALGGRGVVVAQDRLNHASLLDGALLGRGELLRYAHRDAADADARLAQARQGGARPSVVLATDGVFSMDGDVAPLRELAGVARRHQAWFLVDDAHGLGVTGEGGRGCVAAAGLGEDDVPLLVGTLGKAFGAFGAFVAGPRDLVDYVMQRARSYVYTTALPPGVAAAAREGLRVSMEEPWRRERLAVLVERFRRGAHERGLPLAASDTPIQPVPVADAAAALAASAALRERGFWVAAIRPPTVPTARLRVTLSAAHAEADVDALLDALRDALPRADPGTPA